ncbi:hypothetical protein FF36_00058 [Frankia torreyi]|uniref:Uncharacterized protein n=1 Tax=Frankia torreyi TaxID=1856 RepID=A0A0D8BMX5_9ACTN|nr:hypothetical protein FF36_00058 [Frankia torreyi]KQM04805.1 hypothetical protein FF86_102260 [Frankia sp. CpI1-P]
MILPVIVTTLCAIGALGHGARGLRRPASFGEERHDRQREVPVGPD